MCTIFKLILVLQSHTSDKLNSVFSCSTPYLCFGASTNRKQYEWMNEYEQQVAHIINIDVAVDYIVQKLNNVITQ